MDTNSINLDDIFAVLPSIPPVGKEYINETTGDKADKNLSRTTSVHCESSKSHAMASNKTQNDIPPEPKSRASTAQSKALTQMSTSNVSVKEPSPEIRAITNPESKAIAADDELLATVFSAVTLPEVHYFADTENAIRHIDDALAGEDTDGNIDDSSLVSDTQHNHPGSPSPRSTRNCSHHSSNQQIFYPESTISHTRSKVSTVSKKSSGSVPHVAESAGQCLNLELNCDKYSNNNDEEETHDSFEPAHLPFEKYKIHEDYLRQRRMTMDSTVSIGESRYGGFDVHDEHGNYTAEEINLHHNEVAYQRPKKMVIKSSPHPVKHTSVSSGGTIQLREINREVQLAKQVQAELCALVERKRAEVDRLRLRKQQSLAKEAAAKFEATRGVSVRTRSIESERSQNSSLPNSNITVNSDFIYEEEPVNTSEVAARQLHNGHIGPKVGKVSLVIPEMEVISGFSTNPRVHKVIVGGHAASTEDDKTVLLFGPAQSGKTSVINSILNYLYDVKKENDFRFVLDVETKKTTDLTAYVINNSILPFSITIVDTPGVIDKKGNKTVSTLIKTWFEQELCEVGAFRLDAISIVLHHDEDSLGWPFIHELAAIKKMFGDDLKSNVLPIITNSEVLPQPTAIRSLTQANISFLEYYKVNNMGFAPKAHGITKLQHNLYFTHGSASLELFFRDLQELIHPLLALLRGRASIKPRLTRLDASASY